MAHPPGSSVPPEGVTPAAASAAGAAPGARGADAAPSRAEIEAVRARDAAALGRFFERYVNRVFGLTLRLVGERALAEDITQEVFLRVHRAAHTLDPERDPGPWVMTIAHNLCRDVWRSGAYRMGRQSESLDGDPAAAERLSSGINQPERDHERSERERVVQDALLALPEHLRAVIVLHDYEGLGHEEIARSLGIEHAAARKRYSRALAALAGLLEGKVE